jgi:ABC-type phosphate/phosphonate transport system substrate-binding protein
MGRRCHILLLQVDLDRHDLAGVLITRLRQALLDMDQTAAGRSALDAFGAHRFIATGVEDYRPVFDYADHIGLDLNSYQYVND